MRKSSFHIQSEIGPVMHLFRRDAAISLPSGNERAFSSDQEDG